jgi:medium-chain acyl-[acyl-carrier-protein] hydrolase
MPAAIEVCPVELPGRGARIDEPAFGQMDALAETLCGVLQPLLDLPFALFGHSMGAYVAYELGRRLTAAHGQPAAHLFVSGAAAPDRAPRRPPLHSLPEPDLIRALHALGGTPASVLAREELVAALLPTIRADLMLAETYVAPRSARLPCSITAFGGASDAIDRRSLQAWSSFTENAFRLHMFAGDHFFVARVGAAVVEEIIRDLHPPARVGPQRTGYDDGRMVE